MVRVIKVGEVWFSWKESYRNESPEYELFAQLVKIQFTAGRAVFVLSPHATPNVPPNTPIRYIRAFGNPLIHLIPGELGWR